MAKIIGSKTAGTISGLNRTKQALREQSYSFGNTHAGTGVHKQNNRGGGLSEKELLEQEILAQTPFRSKDEMMQALNSTHGCDDITLNRILCTLPEIESKISELSIIDYENMMQFIKETPPVANERLISLFTFANMWSNTESKLLRLGFTSQEAEHIKANAIVNKTVYSAEKILSICDTKEELDKHMEQMKRYDMICRNGIFAEQLESLHKRVHFLLTLQNLGFSAQNIRDNCNAAFIHFPTNDPLIGSKDGLRLCILPNDIHAYETLLTNIIPDLIQLGATFKVANGETLESVQIIASPDFEARTFIDKHPEFINGQYDVYIETNTTLNKFSIDYFIEQCEEMDFETNVTIDNSSQHTEQTDIDQIIYETEDIEPEDV